MKRRLPLALLAGAGVVWAFPAALKVAFRPPRREIPTTPADLDLPGDDVWLDGPNGKKLHTWFIPVSGLAPAVVVLHGWGGNSGFMLPFAVPLRQAGFHVLFVDARGHGMSERDDFSSMPRFAEDLDVAVDWLRARTDVRSVGVVGHSVGAAASILATSRRSDVGAVVAVASFAHPGEFMESAKPIVLLPRPLAAVTLKTIERVIGFGFDDIAPRNRIGRVTAPLLLIHGDEDRTVPISNLHELTNSKPSAQVIVVQGAGHSDGFEALAGDVVGFLSEHLS